MYITPNLHTAIRCTIVIKKVNYTNVLDDAVPTYQLNRPHMYISLLGYTVSASAEEAQSALCRIALTY